MPVYEVMVEIAVRHTGRYEAEDQAGAVRKARAAARKEIALNPSLTSVNVQDFEVSAAMEPSC